MVPPEDSVDWRRSIRAINDRLDEGEKRFGRIETLAAERHKTAGERHREILGAIEGLRSKKKKRELPEYTEEDEEDSVSHMDLDELRPRARQMKKKAKRDAKIKMWGKVAAPFFGGLCIGLWELFKRTVLQ